ncbi:b50132ee-9268-4965-8904-ec1ac1c8e270 [Sclerotinia trifoliorum]|uniref:B50132ee-9268-4965-8904-ec1ac1c8e270 n=1 Tax=Sclerotinia trifoliorum TaxID=28548 RepID=A0A8H2VR30_9HELO|nr:b50132ee-9268-4965-8904-ec1ac1c8e270 [Sclerotinia trifoliorum]
MRVDESKNGLASLSGTLLGLTTITIILRFIARRKQKASLLIDDWMVFSAWFMGYIEPKNHKLVASMHAEVEKTYTALNGLTVITLGLTKLSALLFYRRVFCTDLREAFNVVPAVVVTVVALWTLGFFIMTFLICGANINYLFGVGASASAKCGAIFPYFMGTTISDFLLDVFILTLAIPKIWSLNMTLKRKIAVFCVFLLAFVGLASSTSRMAIAIILVTKGRAVDDEDVYGYWTYLIILEAGLTIVAVNLPSLWYYLAGVSPERILRTVRSVISLRSIRSGLQSSSKSVNDFENKSGTGSGSKRDQSLGTNSSSSYLTYPKWRTVETYTMVDMPAQPQHQNNSFVTPATDGILLNHTIQRTEEQV